MPFELTFGSAILVGLLGSSHCIGMCGGIVSALNVGIGSDLGRQPGRLFAYHLAYNSGRILSYLLVGLLAGALGGSLVRLGVNPAAGKLLAAGFMIALGLYLANWWRGLALLERLGYRLWQHIRPLGEKLLPVRSLPQAALLGMLWGWLPCGLVYSAVAWSLTAGNARDGALLMLGFGIGTLPALLAAGNAMHYLQHWVRSARVRATAGVMIIALGIYTGYSALGTGTHHHHSAVSALFDSSFSGLAATRAPAMRRNV
jgi:sulfite exporter TauE/SafE